MKTQSFLLALAAAPAALAHTVWTGFYVDGVEQGDGVAMRMRQDAAQASDPLEDLSSNDMACNVDGATGVARVQSVQDGSTLTFEFRSWPDDPTKERLDRGHKGPCAVYLKKVDSAIDDPGHGEGWFKIWDDGYDAESKEWCTDKMIDNNGLMSVVLPTGLKGGYYLARPEILALHAANAGDPQFYAGCAQIFLESTGNLVPEETVSIPGYVKAGEDSVSFDIYNTDNAEYSVPGPTVAKLSSSSSAAVANVKAQKTQTEGLKPESCILENANYCFKELPSYSDEAGCWKANENCWTQGDGCWKSAPPTGSAGCKIWEQKCNNIEAQCQAKNFNGPPNKGKDLNPKAETIDVGLVLPTSGVTGGSPAKTIAAAVKSSAPAYTSATAVPKPTSAYEEDAQEATGGDNGYAGPTVADASEGTPISTPASEAAPAPTSKAVCPAGYECVYKTTTVVVTTTAYSTVYVDQKRRSLHGRRSGF